MAYNLQYLEIGNENSGCDYIVCALRGGRIAIIGSQWQVALPLTCAAQYFRLAN